MHSFWRFWKICSFTAYSVNWYSQYFTMKIYKTPKVLIRFFLAHKCLTVPATLLLISENNPAKSVFYHHTVERARELFSPFVEQKSSWTGCYSNAASPAAAAACWVTTTLACAALFHHDGTRLSLSSTQHVEHGHGSALHLASRSIGGSSDLSCVSWALLPPFGRFRDSLVCGAKQASQCEKTRDDPCVRCCVPAAVQVRPVSLVEELWWNATTRSCPTGIAAAAAVAVTDLSGRLGGVMWSVRCDEVYTKVPCPPSATADGQFVQRRKSINKSGENKTAESVTFFWVLSVSEKSETSEIKFLAPSRALLIKSVKSVDLRGRKVLPVGAGPRRTPERRKFLLAGVVWGAVKIKKNIIDCGVPGFPPNLKVF